MRVGVLFLGLTSCQWLSGIDPARSQPVEASVDSTVADASDAGSCDPGGCMKVLLEGTPGPVLVSVQDDHLIYSVADGSCYSTYTISEIWKVSKTGGTPTQLSKDLCAAAFGISGDLIGVVDQHDVTQLELDGTAKFIASTNENRGMATVVDGYLYWISRYEGIWRAALDKSSPAKIVVPFVMQLGSTALYVSDGGLLWGEDSLGPNAGHLVETPNDAGSTLLADFPGGSLTGLAKLGETFYFSVRNEKDFSGSFWAYDGKAVRLIFGTPKMYFPARVIAKAPYLYVLAHGSTTKNQGGIYRYDPAGERWLTLLETWGPEIDVDADFVYYTEEVRDGDEVYRRRLARMAR